MYGKNRLYQVAASAGEVIMIPLDNPELVKRRITIATKIRMNDTYRGFDPVDVERRLMAALQERIAVDGLQMANWRIDVSNDPISLSTTIAATAECISAEGVSSIGNAATNGADAVRYINQEELNRYDPCAWAERLVRPEPPAAKLGKPEAAILGELGAIARPRPG